MALFELAKVCFIRSPTYCIASFRLSISSQLEKCIIFSSNYNANRGYGIYVESFDAIFGIGACISTPGPVSYGALGMGVNQNRLEFLVNRFLNKMSCRLSCVL